MLTTLRATGNALSRTSIVALSGGQPLSPDLWKCPTIVAVRLAIPAQFGDFRLDLVRGDPSATLIEAPYIPISSMEEAIALPQLPTATDLIEYKQALAWPGIPIADDCQRTQRWDTSRIRITVDLNGYTEAWAFFLQLLIVEGHHSPGPAGECTDGACSVR